MTKKDEYKEKVEYLKQMIILLNGKQAYDRIEHQYNIDKTNRLLKIEKPEDFNKAILEKAVLDNV